MFYPTKQELSKNGEGSLVRSRMAGCGPVDLSSNLSPCSIILTLLRQRALTQKHLIQQIELTDRAIRYILSRLLKEGKIVQRASLFDARQSYYEVVK